MDIECKVFSKGADVPWDHWEQIRARAGGDVFMEPRFLSVVETTMSDVSQLWYVIFYLGSGSPVACTCLSTLRVNLTVIATPGIQQVIKRLQRAAPSLLHLNILFCGLPVSLGQKNLLFTAEADKPVVVAQLDELIAKLARTHYAWFIVFKDFGNEYLDDLKILLDRGYRRADSLGINVFDEPFDDFAHYLANLNSHYRYDIRRSRLKLEHANVQIMRWDQPDTIRATYTSELHQLYLAVVDNAENKLEIVPFEFFHELTRRLPGEVRLTGLVQDGKVLAFNWSLATGSTYHFLFCGIDYTANSRLDLYFNLMYAELGNGLQLGVPEIKVGQTTDHFKARLGCRIRPLNLFVKGVGGITDRLFNLAFPLLFPIRQVTQRPDIYRSDYKAKHTAGRQP